MNKFIHCYTALLIVALYALSAINPALAQTNPAYPVMRFERLTIEDGLSQNAALSIMQDSQGYLWIGTQDGLNRYDGYTFSTFRHDSGDPGSLSNSGVLSMVEDKNGLLWIGTWGGGLDRLDPVSGIFTAYRHDPTDPSTISDDTVTDLLITKAGVFWVATMGGLNRFDPQTGKFSPYRNDPRNSKTISADNPSVLFEDTQGRLWVGTGFGVDGKGLNRYEPVSETFIRYVHDPNDATSLSSDNVSSLFEDKQGRLWVGTGGYSLAGSGLNRYDPSTNSFVRYQNDPADPQSLSSDNVMSIWQDDAGLLWVATWGGLNLFDAQAMPAVFEHVVNNPYDPSSLSVDIIWTIYADHSGVVWLGTLNGGVNKFNQRHAQFELYRHNPNQPDSLSFDVVSSFYEDRHDNFWVGTWGAGLEKFDRLTGKFSHFQPDPADPASFPSTHVMSFYEDSTGAFWIATMNGLVRFDLTAGRFTTYQHDAADFDTLINDSVNSIVEDKAGRLWVSTMGGLDRYDRLAGKFIHYQNDPANPGSLSGSRAVLLYNDRDGNLWVGTWGGGLNRYNPQSDTFTRYMNDPANPSSLAENSVWTMLQDKRGRLWIGTQSGLNLMKTDGTFKRYGLNDGLRNEIIMGILEDNQGKLWISTGNGLARFDPETEKFKVFDASDGLQSNEFDSGAYYKDHNGILYFGGIHGFNVFNPEVIQDNQTPPPVAVTSLRVFNEAVKVDLSGKTRLDVPYWQNFIAFEFAAFDYHAPDKNQYAYRLEGFDSDWINSGSRRYASYTNLPAGDYTFRVKAANSDGVWNEMGVAVPIKITPPFWGTWWFRGVVGLLIVGLLVTGYRMRMSAIQGQKNALEQRVDERTHELAEANQRLIDEVEQRQRAEQALAAKAAEEAVSAERTRLARDLHDAVTQTLFSASLIAEVLPDLWQMDVDEAKNSTEELRQLTRGALAEMRTLLLELRPAALTQTRLGDLLKQLSEALIGRARLPIKLTIDGERQLPPDVQVVLYRIAQESLNNVFKYARATQVDMNLILSPAGVHLEINDNGLGFDMSNLKPTSLGMRIMRERAETIHADLYVASAPGKGTQVSVTWNENQTQDFQ